MVLADRGHWHDPRAYAGSPALGRRHARVLRALHRNLVAPVMQRVIHDIRQGEQPGTPAARRKPS
jgi:hypothetical protein